jgi:hypothetical protein
MSPAQMGIQMPMVDSIEATREIHRLEKLQHMGFTPTPSVELPGFLSDSKQLFSLLSVSKVFTSGLSSPFRSSWMVPTLLGVSSRGNLSHYRTRCPSRWYQISPNPKLPRLSLTTQTAPPLQFLWYLLVVKPPVRHPLLPPRPIRPTSSSHPPFRVRVDMAWGPSDGMRGQLSRSSGARVLASNVLYTTVTHEVTLVQLGNRSSPHPVYSVNFHRSLASLSDRYTCSHLLHVRYSVLYEYTLVPFTPVRALHDEAAASALHTPKRDGAATGGQDP